MSWRCAVPCCRPRWEARIPTKLFSVPFETETRLQAWFEACPFLRTYDVTALEHVKLCKIHFTPDCFDDQGRLTSDAVPTLKLRTLIDETSLRLQYNENKQLFIEITPIATSSSDSRQTISPNDDDLLTQYCSIDSEKIISCACGAMFPDQETLHAHITNTRKRFFKCKDNEDKKYDAIKLVENDKIGPDKKIPCKVKADVFAEFKIPNKNNVPRNVNTLLKSKNPSKLNHNITNIKKRKLNLEQFLESQIMTAETSKSSIPTMPLTTKQLNDLKESVTEVKNTVSTNLTHLKQKSIENQNSGEVKSNSKQEFDMQSDNIVYTIVKKNNNQTDCSFEAEEYEIVMENLPPIAECTKTDEDHNQPIEECIELDKDNKQSVEECPEIDVENNQQVEKHIELLLENKQEFEEYIKITEEHEQPVEEHTETILEYNQPIQDYTQIYIQNQPIAEHTESLVEKDQVVEQYSETPVVNDPLVEEYTEILKDDQRAEANKHTKIVEENIQICAEHNYSNSTYTEKTEISIKNEKHEEFLTEARKEYIICNEDGIELKRELLTDKEAANYVVNSEFENEVEISQLDDDLN